MVTTTRSLGAQAPHSSKRRPRPPRLLCAILFISVTALAAPPADLSREQAIKLVAQIQRADYEGDRAALKHLYGELTAPTENSKLGSRVRYWRGFALWRRAMNGFNDSADPKELEDDLTAAVGEFKEAARIDPGFVDAKVGAPLLLQQSPISEPKEPGSYPGISSPGRGVA